MTTRQTLQNGLTIAGIIHDYDHTRVGPTVETHAFRIHAPIAKLERTARDLGIALGLPTLRVVAPLPGGLVGIEVPKDERASVDWAEYAAAWPAEDGLNLTLGLDAIGEPARVDLAKLPHLLVAGTTGSGKSVALTSMVTDLINQSEKGDRVRLHLVDPKRVELGHFAPAAAVERIVNDVDDALEVLRDVVGIMDGRYKSFEHEGVRNIAEYNASLVAGYGVTPLPYHVVVIDELADLMMRDKDTAKQAETEIVRIAQLGRAAGIHLIVATQRPTVDVVTGLIKANIPARWAFTVATNKDSQVILDAAGAQTLIGRGDSLLLEPGKPLLRVQAALVNDDDLAEILHKESGEAASSVGADAASDDDALDDEPDLEPLGQFDRPFTEAELEALVEVDEDGWPVIKDAADWESLESRKARTEAKIQAGPYPPIAVTREELEYDKPRFQPTPDNPWWLDTPKVGGVPLVASPHMPEGKAYMLANGHAEALLAHPSMATKVADAMDRKAVEELARTERKPGDQHPLAPIRAAADRKTSDEKWGTRIAIFLVGAASGAAVLDVLPALFR